MNLRNFSWHDNSRKFKKDAHALFGASKYHWINYSEEKMIKAYTNSLNVKVGTELHDTARLLIKNKIKLPDTKNTLNMYVNDSIYYEMDPEQQLYFSDLFFGTTDAIRPFSESPDGILRIFDLKTGETPASMHQLEVYAAFFFLEYYGDWRIDEIKDLCGIELRIYQNNDILISNPTPNEIQPIMDKIVTVDAVIQKLKGGQHE